MTVKAKVYLAEDVVQQSVVSVVVHRRRVRRARGFEGGRGDDEEPWDEQACFSKYAIDLVILPGTPFRRVGTAEQPTSAQARR